MLHLDVNNNRKIDTFSVVDFPELVRELTAIKVRMHNMPGPDKATMVISFSKHHRIQASLVRLHPQVSKVISSKNAAQQLETVYAAYKDQPDFVSSLDQYLMIYFND